MPKSAEDLNAISTALTDVHIDSLQGMKSEANATEELATFLLRVKEEEQADEFVAMIKKYKSLRAAGDDSSV